MKITVQLVSRNSISKLDAISVNKRLLITSRKNQRKKLQKKNNEKLQLGLKKGRELQTEINWNASLTAFLILYLTWLRIFKILSKTVLCGFTWYKLIYAKMGIFFVKAHALICNQWGSLKRFNNRIIQLNTVLQIRSYIVYTD